MPTINLNSRESAPYDYNACPSQTDRHHGNIVTIRSNERIAH